MADVTTATLAGNNASDVRLQLSQWGLTFADVTLSAAVTLTGKVTLVVGDLTVQCTVLSGGPAADAGRSYYRVVAGAGGWGKQIPAKGYANDAGVKLLTVLTDAAAACGETFDTTTIDPTARLGPAFTRPADLACRVLEIVSPGAWYVGEDGLTRLGKRAPSTLSGPAPRTSELDLASGFLTLASPMIAGVLPGITVDGLTAVDVEHEFSAGAGLRSRLWGNAGTGASRSLAAWRKLFDQLDPRRVFRGTYEYRIVSQSGNRLDLQPVQVSTGVPSLSRVIVRPGVPGVSAQYTLGARVLVTWVNADPGRPVVVAHEDADGAAFVPISLALVGGGPAVARVGDHVQITFTSAYASGIESPDGACTLASGEFEMTGTITSGSSKVTCG